MTTIGEDYVSFEIARQLKEKGFNEQCFTYYDNTYDNTNDSINRFDKGYHFNNTSYPWGVPYNINNAKKYVCAPTLQMTMKWLRETYHIFIQVELYSKHNDYCFEVFQNTHRLTQEHETYDNYEQACEAGIKYCLENLI